MNEWEYQSITPEGQLEFTLTETLELAKMCYVENGKNDFDAGRVDGLKQALEILQAWREKNGI